MGSKPGKTGQGQKAPAVSSPSEPTSGGRNISWPSISATVAVVALLLTIAVTVSNISYFSGGRDARIGDLSNNVVGLGIRVKDIENRLVGMETALAKMEGKIDGFLNRARAMEAGLKDPQIVPVKLSELSHPQIIIEAKGEYRIEMTVKEVTSTSIVFKGQAWFGTSQLMFEHIELPRQVGVPVDLSNVINFPGMPHILMAVVDAPEPDRVIVAFGPKNQEGRAVS